MEAAKAASSTPHDGLLELKMRLQEAWNASTLAACITTKLTWGMCSNISKPTMGASVRSEALARLACTQAGAASQAILQTSSHTEICSLAQEQGHPRLSIQDAVASETAQEMYVICVQCPLLGTSLKTMLAPTASSMDAIPTYANGVLVYIYLYL